MTLSCSDLGSLCRAAEDRRYSLRNNEETLKLKQILFFRTKAEMDAYHDMSASRKTGQQRRSSDKEAAFEASGRSSRKRSWSMSTRLGRKPTPTPNSTQRYTPRKGAVPRIRCVLYKVAEMGNYLLFMLKSFPIKGNDISRTSSDILFLYPFLQKGGEANGYQRQKTKADRHEGTGR